MARDRKVLTLKPHDSVKQRQRPNALRFPKFTRTNASMGYPGTVRAEEVLSKSGLLISGSRYTRHLQASMVRPREIPTNMMSQASGLERHDCSRVAAALVHARE